MLTAGTFQDLKLLILNTHEDKQIGDYGVWFTLSPCHMS